MTKPSRIRAILLRALPGACVLLAFVALDVSAEDIKSWLDRMNRAVEELNYEGTFVRILDGDAETLYVVHRNDGNEIGEKISALGGVGSEIIRHGQEVRCVLPDRKVVLLEEPRGPSNPLASSLPNYSEVLEENYEFMTFRRGQVARRDTQIVVIRPKDEFRYGYKLWLDVETAMPLKAQVRDENNSVVEQVLFTDFSLHDSIPESALSSNIDTEDFTWIRSSQGQSPVTDEAAWYASKLPSGFELTGARRSEMEGAENPIEHLVYSDGLATVSVFVADPKTQVSEGFSRLGSTNAYSVIRSGRKVTAMGEVPRLTVQSIASSLEFR